MKAMVLAAGEGTRLRPLTDGLPKALLPLAGDQTLLGFTLERLRRAGVRSFVVNAHHLAGLVEEFCRDYARRTGLPVAVSREDLDGGLLLDTGGGVRKAAALLGGEGSFLLHNADAIGDLDLAALRRAHEASGALATLACRERDSSRALLFGEDGLLRGWRRGPGLPTLWAGAPDPAARPLAYDGAAALSGEFPGLLAEEGPFPLPAAWLRLAREGRPVRAFRSDASAWFDAGRPETLAAARAWADGKLRG